MFESRETPTYLAARASPLTMQAPATLQEKLRPFWAAARMTPPSAKDVACTKALLEYLDEEAPLESESERALREQLLVDLQKLTSTWVKDTCVKKGIPEEDSQGGKLFISGSYRMGVNQKGGDIDTVLVVPHVVSREDFFDEGPDGLLARLRGNPTVTKVLPIPTAVVPIIEVVWGGIDIDVLFARLSPTTSKMPQVPDDLLDDSLLANADEATIRSLNGPRVTEMLIKYVPDYETFVIVLRALRLFAKRRGIYSNKMGFLGGVNFAILAAFGVQFYPKETASRCLVRLMNFVKIWQWPAPMRLVHPYVLEGAASIEHLSPQWDQNLNHRDRMPLITPAHPNANSSYNVTDATLGAMLREFSRGHVEASKVLKTKGLDAKGSDWAAFFAPTDFFVRYKVYVCVTAKVTTNEDNKLDKWTGYMESRIRKLVELMENKTPYFEIFPYPTGLDDIDKEPEMSLKVKRWFIGYRADPYLARNSTAFATAGKIDLEGVVSSFLQNVLEWKERDDAMAAYVDVLSFPQLATRWPSLVTSNGKHSMREILGKHKIAQDQAKADLDKAHNKTTAAVEDPTASAAANPAAAPGQPGDAPVAEGANGEAVEPATLATRKPKRVRQVLDVTRLSEIRRTTNASEAYLSAQDGGVKSEEEERPGKFVAFADLAAMVRPQRVSVVLRAPAAGQ